MIIAVRSLFVGLLVLSACGNGAPPGDADTDGGACTGSLSEVRALWGPTTACPDDYDATLAPAFGCGGSPPTVSAGLAGDVLVARLRYATHGGTCFYDATTRRLVGALKWDDTPSFCNRTSSEIRAGTAPAGCTGPVPSGCTLTRTDRQADCLNATADGGADGG